MTISQTHTHHGSPIQKFVPGQLTIVKLNMGSGSGSVLIALRLSGHTAHALLV